jgi:hypothetical protein
MRALLTLPLAAAALVAQAPAPTLVQKVAAETKAIEALKAENPGAAYDQAKALLPATKPAFDKTNIQTAYGSIKEWNAMLDIRRMMYNTAISAGRFELAKESAEAARDLAKELQAEAMGPFQAYKATWQKAGEEATKALEEIATLTAVDEKTRTPEQVQRLSFLTANETTFKTNVENAKKVMASLEGPLKNLDAQTRDFDGPIAQVEKRLKDEAEDKVKPAFKGDNVKYAAALVASVGLKPENKDAALVSLHRAQVLDPKNTEAQKYIDYLLGKGPAPKVKAAPKAAKGKKK